MSKPSAKQENEILGCMMNYLMRGTETVSFEKLSNDIGFHIRSKTWVASWKSLINDHEFVEPATSGASMATGQHRLTEKGKEHASTPEYKAYVKDLNFVPATNEDRQNRIKKRLMNDYGRKIFDLLLKHGSLDRQVMAAVLKTRSGSHKFSYALKELRDKEYVEVDTSKSSRPQKLRLADKSFLNADEDRPEPIDLDQKVLNDAMAFSKTVKKRASTSTSKGDEDTKEKKQRTGCSSSPPGEEGDVKTEEGKP